MESEHGIYSHRSPAQIRGWHGALEPAEEALLGEEHGGITTPPMPAS
jgi:hypothetical protein